jgi:hypothetical protein
MIVYKWSSSLVWRISIELVWNIINRLDRPNRMSLCKVVKTTPACGVLYLPWQSLTPRMVSGGKLHLDTSQVRENGLP